MDKMLNYCMYTLLQNTDIKDLKKYNEVCVFLYVQLRRSIQWIVHLRQNPEADLNS